MSRCSSYILFAAMLSVLFFTTHGKQGFSEYLTISQEVEQLKTNNRKLLREIYRLEQKMAQTRDNPFVLEQKARQELALSKPGDIVYIFPRTNDLQDLRP